MGPIAYIIEKFPSPTEYFVLNEISELEKLGAELRLLVINRQKKYENIPEIKNINAQIICLPRILRIFPFIVFFINPLLILSVPISKYSFSIVNRIKEIRNYCYCVYFITKLKREKVAHVHAHFAFIAVDLARILSKIVGVKYSLTAHAQDIYTNQEKFKQLIESLSFVITCTKYNGIFIKKLVGKKYDNKIRTIYHGIRLSDWKKKITSAKKDSSSINILSIARLVEKKGLTYLIKAIKLLVEEGKKVNCMIIGEGPMKKQLEEQIADYNLDKAVKIIGFVPQYEIKEHYAQADIFVLPCIVASNGDRDGLPNVVLECMCYGIPVISTPISAIPEAIIHQKTGLLVNPKDEKALAEAITVLETNKSLARNISFDAEQKIHAEFSLEKCTRTLLDVFESGI